MTHTAESLQKAFKYLFPDEVPFLKKLARSLPPDPRVVNIGAGAGTSGLAFRESREDLVLFTVDSRGYDSPLGSLFAEYQVLKEAGLWGDRTIQYLMDSRELARVWLNGPVDLVFVDDGHKYKECRADILGWLPHVKDGGIMAVHDYRKGELYASETDYQPDKPHPQAFPGVDRAVDELLLSKYPLIERVDSTIAFRIGDQK